MPAAPTVDDADVAYWRARAEQAEARAEAAEAQVGQLQARVEELTEQVAVLSRMMFGRSSERNGGGPADAQGRPGGGPGEGLEGEGWAEGGRKPGGGKRGQRPGSRGHGRRDYSHLDTREEIHDVPEAERVCAGCGVGFALLGSEDSEQIDWEVTVTRLVHRRRRYRRRCGCPGPRTVVAPVPGKPVRKGRFTAAFLARLL